MRLLEEQPFINKSIWNQKGMSVLEKGFFYGGLFDEDAVIESGASSRDEEFLASVLMMIKSEEVNNQQDMRSKIKRFEYISQTCDEHKWKHAMCPPNCPNRRIERILKWSEDGPYHLDGETGSSSLEEENGIRYHTDGGSSSDELFDDIAYRRRLAKIRTKPSTSSSAVKPKKPKRLPSKLDIDATYSNGNAKIRGTKRKTESYDSFHADVVSQPKRKYSKQRKVIKGMEMFWNAPTESYGLAKPKSSEQYELIVRWSLSQLPKKCGTTEDVFSTVKENGWPELKKGNTREALICKNTITKILYEHFMEKSIDQKGEVVFCFGDEEDENVDVEEDGHTDVDPKSTSYSKHRIEERYTEDCLSSRNSRKADSAEELKRLERKPRREIRKKLSETDSAVWQLSSSSSSNCVEDEASEEAHQTPTVPKKAKKAALPSNSSSLARGRRWVRFACEKHRREHARCPDNCPMRKKSYVEEEVIDDENTPDDMETESLHLKDTIHAEEEVIVDESSM